MNESLLYSFVNLLLLAVWMKRKKITVFMLLLISPQNSHKACELPAGSSSPGLWISPDVHSQSIFQKCGGLCGIDRRLQQLKIEWCFKNPRQQQSCVNNELVANI